MGHPPDPVGRPAGGTARTRRHRTLPEEFGPIAGGGRFRSVALSDGAVRLPAVAREETYTHGHHESVLRSHRWRTIENSAAYLLPYLSPGLDVLDVGCGPGTITID